MFSDDRKIRKQAIEDGIFIEVSENLLYQIWINKPLAITNILYRSIIMHSDKDVESFRLLHFLEKISSQIDSSIGEIKFPSFRIHLGNFNHEITIIQNEDDRGNIFYTVGFSEDFILDSNESP